jgi:hypothetical protein
MTAPGRRGWRRVDFVLTFSAGASNRESRQNHPDNHGPRRENSCRYAIFTTAMANGLSRRAAHRAQRVIA